MKSIRNFILASFLLTSFISSAQHWTGVGGGTDFSGRNFYLDTATNKLLLHGLFNVAGQDTAKGLASWDGSAWSSMGTDLLPCCSSEIRGLVRFNDTLYASGSFFGTNTQYFCRWDGTEWDSITNLGMQGFWGLFSWGNYLVAYGAFDSVGTVHASDIAKWDGESWSAFDTTHWSGGTIVTANVFQGELYIGGNFDNYNYSLGHLVKWNGTSWISPGNFHFYGGVCDINMLTVYNNELYAGGIFFTSDGNPGTGIAKWNGTTWSDVGGGMGGWIWPQVYSMKVYNGKLYAVGFFRTAGGVNVQNIATWDGTDWCGLGNTSINRIADVEFYNNEMYIIAGDRIVDGDTVNYVAKWIGGTYVDSCGHIVAGINEQSNNSISVLMYPNPVGTNAIFQFQDSQKTKTIFIYNQLGKEIWRKETGEKQIEVSVADLEDGMYFYQVVQKDNIRSGGKFIVQH